MSRLPELAPAALSFHFLAEIASGATTRIELCRSVGPHRSGELLAVKRLHPQFAEDPIVATRFLDEVWMTAALKHPNVVEVAGWGNDEHGNYLAVELVQGVSLARLMKTVFDTGEAFPERLIVDVAAQICRGLAAAHGVRSRDGTLLNLVHRDLTPGNVLIGFKGEVKIADFGLAKSALRMALTLSGTLKGEPTYMAPEQARGTSVDHRSDLFSLGVMLFELFAGKHPWSAATDYEMVKSVATRPPADLRELRPKIDKELVAIVMRCLEKDPAARFQSADEVHTRLDAWRRGHGCLQGSEEALGRFVLRNAMRQMRWFERAVAGNVAGPGETSRVGVAPLQLPPYDRAPQAPKDDELDAKRAAQAKERLRGEADRLKTESTRLREEARVAVAQAERRVTMASVAAHLAAMAAEALQFSASAGGTLRATRHLEEALTLEQAMHRVAAVPLALPPDAGVGPISAGHEQEDMLAQLGLAHLASPSITSRAVSKPHPSSRPPRPMSSRPPPRSVRAGPGSGSSYLRSGEPGASNFAQAGNLPYPATTTPFPGAPLLPDFSGVARMGIHPLASLEAVAAAGNGRSYMPHEGGAGYPDHEGAVLPSSSAVLPGQAAPPGPISANPDGLKYQTEAQPMFFGVPRNVAFAIVAGVFTVVLLLLWLFFS